MLEREWGLSFLVLFEYEAQRVKSKGSLLCAGEFMRRVGCGGNWVLGLKKREKDEESFELGLGPRGEVAVVATGW